ncbi:hypothetical protein [Brevibacillus fulvus]|uniref:Uncharacterized protein n=1 Tax=Brevibacillus fulvus TaxID=1125967 RepID=A0A939BUF1_9BACL|nr:hypothetical protein [Brevibacillus fulvus]MBM7590404.1 hypothetical protein [Brevibacillus fulvus]
MHYYGNETIMSLEQVLRLKPNEVRILEWVRTYEYLENQYGLDDPVNEFLEIKCVAEGVLVRKNRITEFPEYECLEERLLADAEEALAILQEWATEILQRLASE